MQWIWHGFITVSMKANFDRQGITHGNHFSDLSFPAVPSIIPSELGGLTGLQSLKFVGNGQVPAGDFPTSMKRLSALTTLHLESTGMNALPDDLFSSLRSVSTLLLSENDNFNGGLPSTIGQSSLRSLCVLCTPQVLIDNRLNSWQGN